MIDEPGLTPDSHLAVMSQALVGPITALRIPTLQIPPQYGTQPTVIDERVLADGSTGTSEVVFSYLGVIAKNIPVGSAITVHRSNGGTAQVSKDSATAPSVGPIVPGSVRDKMVIQSTLPDRSFRIRTQSARAMLFEQSL